MSGPTPAEQRRAAEVYEAFHVRYLFTSWARDLVRRAAPRRGERVLDVACGTGIVARTVAPLVGAGGTVVGVDINPVMLAVARTTAPAGAPAIDWRTGDATALPLPDHSIDLVLCEQGLQFFPDKPGAVREMRRVLAPGGRAVVSVWRSLEDNSVAGLVIRALAGHFGTPAVAAAYAFSDAAALCALLVGAGFRDVAVEPVTLTLRFPRARFVAETIRSAAAVVPALAQADEPTLARAAAEIERETAPALRPYVQGDDLVGARSANVATAHV